MRTTTGIPPADRQLRPRRAGDSGCCAGAGMAERGIEAPQDSGASKGHDGVESGVGGNDWS